MTPFAHALGRTLAAALLVFALPAAAVAPPKGTLGAHRPNQLIVKFRDDSRVVDRDAQMMRLGAETIARFGRGRNTLLRLPQGTDLKQAIARLEASGVVEYAHPNFIRRKLASCTSLAVPKHCPNDTLSSNQYYLHNPFPFAGGGESDADMDMPEAWNVITSSSVLLAIIDDGFQIGHPDLDANLRDGLSCNEATGTCNGNASSQSSAEAHGTYVAGSAAAVGDNSQGVTGVVMAADVLPLRMPNYSTDEVVLSVDEAIAQGAKVINMSFGSADFSQAEMDAIDRARTAGILVFASAGNDDTNTDKAVSTYPANYPLDNVIAVAASDAIDDITGFSTWGSFSVELAAAGDGVHTTELGGGYGGVDGTSFSSPITAGAAVLIGQHMINNAGSWDRHEVKARLLAGAENASDNGDLPLRGRVAAGRVNVFKSLNPVTGGVLLVNGLSFDDNTGIDIGNDADGQPDPGETFDINITIENAWQAAGTVNATLSTTDTDATVTNGNAVFPSTAAFGSSTAAFRVQLGSFTSNEQIRFRLDLTPQTGAAQTRYFYLEVGELRNGVEITQAFQRTNWDEVHGWHATVPTGSSNVVFETFTNTIDIDLIARRTTPPTYFLYQDVDMGETCDPSDECSISAGPNGNEQISSSQSGVWHLVVLNFTGVSHSYRIKASWDALGAGTIRFAAPSLVTNESVGSATIQVVRSGGVGAVSANYTFASGTATSGSDFTAVNGTLNWANGDTAAKSILVPITADSTSENNETFTITLDTPTGGADIGRYSVNTVTIGNATSGGGGGGGGGGATDPLLLAGLLASLLAARRRRSR